MCDHTLVFDPFRAFSHPGVVLRGAMTSLMLATYPRSVPRTRDHSPVCLTARTACHRRQFQHEGNLWQLVETESLDALDARRLGIFWPLADQVLKVWHRDLDKTVYDSNARRNRPQWQKLLKVEGPPTLFFFFFFFFFEMKSTVFHGKVWCERRRKPG